ncbi:phage baseplate assembly protein V [Zoogloea sp.]|uniref:phage baseplate assembly protein V n=1 Tax=Zoogloea sp. TaxID=49181 RepID=UPI0035B20B3B
MNLHDLTVSDTGLEAGGHAKGVAVAIVCNNKDDSGQGRVKVKYPWYKNPTESYWARVATPMAGANRGLYFIPEVDDEVLVAFDRGDVRFPYILGSLWSGKAPAPENNANGKNDRGVIRSRKGHSLSFDDGETGQVRLALNDGKTLTINDEGIRIDDGKGNSLHIDSKGGQLTVEAATKLSLKAPAISIESSGTLEIKAGATLTLQGAMININ